MADVTTLDPLWWPLMDAESVVLPHCAVCGRAWPLNQHHIVFRSQGQLVRGGRAVEKPTVTLCGNGSVLYGVDANGNRVEYCHGKAHHKLLHFRNDRGLLECIELDSPAKYQEALGMGGWRPVGNRRDGTFYEILRGLVASGMSATEAIREMGIDEFG